MLVTCASDVAAPTSNVPKAATAAPTFRLLVSARTMQWTACGRIPLESCMVLPSGLVFRALLDQAACLAYGNATLLPPPPDAPPNYGDNGNYRNSNYRPA